MVSEHNRYIFITEEEGTRLVRDFDGMYSYCADPHGQSKVLDNLSYQLVSTCVERVANILKAENREPLSIIDIGCGLGYFTAHLKEKFPESYVCGVDISDTAVQRATSLASACSFQQADIKIPGDIHLGSLFDIVAALDCLYYFKDDEIDQVLSNLNALMADGGFLVVGYHLPEDMKFGLYIQSLSDAELLFQAHGLPIMYSFDVKNDLDVTYAGATVGRHLYFIARKMA